MTTVDYTKIAETYDDLPIRNEVPADERVRAVLRAGARVLDVGCGTGSWLSAQARAFADQGALWFGVDPSDAMLARARSKLPSATLAVGPAESLPFPDAHFCFVATRFAFHHFTDKPRALDELVRVLEPGGTLLMMNIAPERMPGWWVFRWFPEAAAENARYWPVELLRDELAGRGLEPEIDVRVRRGEVALSEALGQATVRDQSHLFTLDDAVYASRLSALQAACARAPAEATPTESAVLVLYARQRG